MMGPSYGVRTWLKTRRVVSTTLGVLLLGLVGAWTSFNNVTVIQVSASSPRWFLGHTMILGTIAAMIATVNTLPAAPEWERPLLQRTRLAHTGMWLGVIACGALGPILGDVRLAHLDEALASPTAVAFYFAAVGITTTGVILLGRVPGSVAGLVTLFGIVTLEQLLGWSGAIADSRHPAQWLLPTCSFLVALVLIYRSGGVPRTSARR